MKVICGGFAGVAEVECRRLIDILKMDWRDDKKDCLGQVSRVGIVGFKRGQRASAQDGVCIVTVFVDRLTVKGWWVARSVGAFWTA